MLTPEQHEALNRAIGVMKLSSDLFRNDPNAPSILPSQIIRDADTLQSLLDALPALIADAETLRAMKARGAVAWKRVRYEFSALNPQLVVKGVNDACLQHCASDYEPVHFTALRDRLDSTNYVPSWAEPASMTYAEMCALAPPAPAAQQVSVPDDDMRDAFHKWARGAYTEHELRHDRQGVYFNGGVQERFGAWCAALSAVRRLAAEPRNEKGGE